MKGDRDGMGIPEIDLTDGAVIRDPFTAYGRVREQAPLARLRAPGMAPMWALTRHAGARVMLSDPRLEINAGSFQRPDVPADCVPYLRTMTELDGAGHARLRRLVSPAFSPRRAAEARPRIRAIVERLLDDLPGLVDHGEVDLLAHFARPLPMEVICEVVGVPDADRPRWREYGALISAGSGRGFAQAVPGIIEGAKAAVTARRREPGDDLLSDLIRTRAQDGDRLTDTELVTLVWHLVLAGQTPTHLIANAVEVLLGDPALPAVLRADPDLMPSAVEELMRWCGPTLLSVPRHAQEDIELYGSVIRAGEPVTAAIAAANRDPRAFADPDRLDLGRGRHGAAAAAAAAAGQAGHLGFAHGPHFCLGASLARVQTQVALAALLDRFPGLRLAADGGGELRAPDPGTWRLTALPVSLTTGDGATRRP